MSKWTKERSVSPDGSNAIGWVARFADCAGPFVRAAEPLIARLTRGHAAELPKGGPALALVSRCIDRWAEGELLSEEDDERKFVEEAGALLALILLDHVGDGRHVVREGQHRLQMGAYGFFDPFAAVERAIAGPSARRVLIDEVRSAEAEANGTGIRARVCWEFERQLRESRPDLDVEECFESALVLTSGIEVDLARVVRATASQSGEAVAQAIRKFIELLEDSLGARAELSWDEAKTKLLPRLTGPAFRMQMMETSARARVLTRPWVEDVDISLMLAYDGRCRFVNEVDIEGWGVDFGDAFRMSLGNLADRSAHARFSRYDSDEGSLVVAKTGDGLDAARSLLPGLYDVLAQELEPPFAIAIPHRDTLLACSVNDAAALAVVTSRAQDEAKRAPHSISEAPLLLTREGLSELEIAYESRNTSMAEAPSSSA